MSEVDLTRFPESPQKEFAVTAAKVATSFLPVGGSAAVELLSALAPVLNKRRVEWLEDVGTAVKRLQDQVKGLDPTILFDRPEFASAFLQASQEAVRTHEREKLQAVRNAVLNLAANVLHDEDWEPVFLTWIGELTAWHLRVLRFVDKPGELARAHGVKGLDDYGGDGEALLVEVFPELRLKRQFYRRAINDLFAHELIDVNADRFGAMVVAGQHILDRTTRLGKAFLAFITSPIPDLDDAADSTMARQQTTGRRDQG